MGKPYKKNHFVPVTYLKRWTDPARWDDRLHWIYSYNKNDKKIRYRPTKEYCHKKNLYTLSDNYEIEVRKAIEKGFFGYSDGQYSKIMMNSLDRGKIPNTNQTHGLFICALYQSWRSKKFKDETIKAFDNYKVRGDELGKMTNALSEKGVLDYPIFLGYLLGKTFTYIADRGSIEILISNAGKSEFFITSDNPSTYWMQEWNRLIYYPTVIIPEEQQPKPTKRQKRSPMPAQIRFPGAR